MHPILQEQEASKVAYSEKFAPWGQGIDFWMLYG